MNLRACPHKPRTLACFAIVLQPLKFLEEEGQKL